jgi:hypothetical protein
MKRVTSNKTVRIGVVAVVLSALVPILIGSALTGHPISRTAIAACA